MENQDWQELRDNLSQHAESAKIMLASAIGDLADVAPERVLKQLRDAKDQLHIMLQRLKAEIEGPPGYGLQPK